MAHADIDPTLVARAMSLFLLSGLLLVCLFLSATFVLVRGMRRVQRSLWRRPRTPTVSDDVWAMHKLPEDLLWPPDEAAGRFP